MKGQEPKLCSICSRVYTGSGNNAAPVNDGRCCNGCNIVVVLPERLRALRQEAVR